MCVLAIHLVFVLDVCVCVCQPRPRGLAACLSVTVLTTCFVTGDSEESSASEVGAWRSGRAFGVRRTQQSSVAHDSASPLESSFCLFVYLFIYIQSDACGSVAREVVFSTGKLNCKCCNLQLIECFAALCVNYFCTGMHIMFPVVQHVHIQLKVFLFEGCWKVLLLQISPLWE